MAAPELKTLGRYNIERVLGKGAMGVVYEGVDPRLGRRVAIKTILKSHLDEDTAKDYSMRFVREAQAVARLNHPNIVQVYDFGEEGDIAYLVMEFIKGKELKNFFDANERFDLKEAVRIMCELCDALDFAHQAGIVHRDIKPANVMLDHQARTKLTDFGVARVTDTDKTSVERTQAGTMVGTPAYMSPEQITGGNIDRRTDVFSAGIILYQFLTGEKPFTGSGAWTIAKKIIQEEPPLPSSLNNAVTSLFDAVVNKALAKNPENRFQSARDLSVALRRALEGKPEEDDADKTIVGAITDHIAPAPSRATPAQRQESTRSGTTSGSTQAGNQEVELEFWRAIKDGNDPEDFELYVQQFPTGIYAALAKRKIAKLRGVAPEETGAKAKEQERKEAEEAAKREAEVRAKLAEEKDKLEAELRRREEEYRQREAEAEARRLAAEKARAEEDARRDAEAERAKQEALAAARAEAEKARREAEEKARAEAEKAKQEAAAERERARQEAEKARQEAEKAKQEALAAAKAEAEKARREAEEKARVEAEKAKQEAAAERERVRQEAERAKREAEEKARKEAEARAKKDAEERAKREAEFKKREAQLKAQAAAGGKKSSPVAAMVVGIVIVAIAAVGYFFIPKQDADSAAKLQAMQKQLEEAKQKAAELEAQKQKEEQARVALEKARKAEEEARKAGDLKRQQELAQARAQAEAEAKREADATKLREAEAKKTADAVDAARRQADVKSSKVASDKLAQEKALADKLAKEREAVEAERVRLAAEKAAAEKAAADARAAQAAAEKAKQQVAAAAAQSPAPPSSNALLQQAEALEGEGNGKDAVKAYTRAARAGNGKAAKRLGEIYDKGLLGIPRDYAESLKWYNAARVLGEDVPLARGR
jgi:serine/threonine-protein kinase